MIFVRHGQSTANVEQKFTGHLNAALTPLGEKQARNVAVFLKQYPIRKIYASDLKRAMQTAEPTAAMLALPICPDPLLREIDAGKWEGKSYAQLREEYGDSYALWTGDVGNAHPEGGESVRELAERIYRETDRIADENDGSTIALFTHAMPIRTLRARWQGIPVDRLSTVEHVRNASVSVVEYHRTADAYRFRVLLCGYDAFHGEETSGFAAGVI